MDKWKAIQAGVISGVVVVAGVEVCRHPVDNPHAETGTKGSAERIASVMMAAGTTGTMAPFVNTMMDGNEFRQYRPNRQYYDQQQMPLTLRALSVIRDSHQSSGT